MEEILKGKIKRGKMQDNVEASETRGTTALVYCLISSSLYTGTVQGWWSTPPTGLTVSRGEVHPNWSDGQQGCSQLSTKKRKKRERKRKERGKE